MAKLMKVDGRILEVSPLNAKKGFTMVELNKIVGGYFQMVPLKNDEELWCHEEGKIIGLPVNRAATEYCRGSLFVSDFVVGDVLICKRGEVK